MHIDAQMSFILEINIFLISLNLNGCRLLMTVELLLASKMNQV